MEETIPSQAAARYRKVIEGYKSRLKSNPDLKLSDYCKESHTNYRGVIDWTTSHGIFVRKLRSEARGETPECSSQTFIQFAPARRPSTCDLRGISITFPDGVNLTLQESSVESVISLLTVYQSRRGGEEPCSD